MTEVEQSPTTLRGFKFGDVEADEEIQGGSFDPATGLWSDAINDAEEPSGPGEDEEDDGPREPCDKCGSLNTEQQEGAPSMTGHGWDRGCQCLDCGHMNKSAVCGYDAGDHGDYLRDERKDEKNWK